MKRFLLTLAFVASTALALGLAAPARACNGDCVHGPDHAASTGPDRDAAAPTPPARPGAATSDAKCHCEKGGKGCTCPPGKCDCENCGKGKKGA